MKTNVFGGKTGRFVGNIYKNQIIMEKNWNFENAFVKMTKIGIEIQSSFVYNVFIAALETKAASLEGGAFPKGD